MAGRSVPAPFLTKTYQLVDDASSDDVVSWSESGTTFVVWKTAEFAKDLLPNYFKHNNFSSFVRQLNTYGFRKIVPDKWEFANEYFRRGQRDLLSEIRRRKTAPASPARTAAAAAKTAGSLPSPSSSGEDLGSTSTSSPESKSSPRSDETAPAPPPHYAELSGENEKLKRDNEILSSELAQTKKQCEELMAFLAEYVKLGPDQINRIMWPQGSHASSRGGSDPVGAFNDGEDDSNGGYGDGRSGQEGEQEGEEEEEEEEEDRLKLFGVWLKGKKKRGREESMGCGGPHQREMKKMAPWMMGMKMAPAPGETSKVCN